MSALPLFDVDEPEPVVAPEPVPEPVKLREADVLAALRVRYAESYGNGDRWAFATHVRCAAGFGGYGPNSMRTADAVAMDLWPSKGLEIHGHEVKVSRSDWLTELKQPEKSEPVKRYCDRWWLVVSDRAIVKAGELPDDWGLMVVTERPYSRWNRERRGYDVGTERYARVVKAAPKLKPEPISRDFVAPLLRATVKTASRGSQA